jgi:signal transduction histidine kinase
MERRPTPADREDLRAREGLASALSRLLAVEPSGRTLRRMLGAVAEALPAIDLVLLVAGEPRLEVQESFGVEASAASGAPLADEAIAARAPRVAAAPGAPFPPGTRLGAAIPIAGERAALLAGSSTADRLDADDLLVLRTAADRIGLAWRAERVARERDEARAAAERVAEEVRSRRGAVDHILGIVGHDLRNPLGAVHMSAALLQRKGGLEGWQARTVERIRSSAGRMGRIIADLLSYTRTRLGTGLPMERRRASLEPICRRVVDELLAANGDRTITIELAGEASGEWDPDRLEQVASNLVSNAVDHGDPAAPVVVSIDGTGDAVVLEVRNRGDPIPAEVLAHLFEPFSRGPEERSRKGSGLGLGLYIAREIVRAHGGEIAVRCDGGETAISVRLPRS